jgi:hypothetical protein
MDAARAEGAVLAEFVLAECVLTDGVLAEEGRAVGDAAEHPARAAATHRDATEMIDPLIGI